MTLWLANRYVLISIHPVLLSLQINYKTNQTNKSRWFVTALSTPPQEHINTFSFSHSTRSLALHALTVATIYRGKKNYSSNSNKSYKKLSIIYLNEALHCSESSAIKFIFYFYSPHTNNTRQWSGNSSHLLFSSSLLCQPLQMTTILYSRPSPLRRKRWPCRRREKKSLWIMITCSPIWDGRLQPVAGG